MHIGTLLIRADASPEIGTGHVMRCLALAQAWKDQGGDAIFAMAESTAAIRSRLSSENCSFVEIAAAPGCARDADRTLEQALQNRSDWIVVDGYRFDANYLGRIRSQGYRVLCIDDEGKYDHYFADIVLNQNITASKSWYSDCEEGTQLLLGPRFSLLRREFSQWRHWRREIPQIGRKVLVTLGGSTPVELGVRILESLRAMQIEGLEAVVAVGGSTPDATRLERCAGRTSKISIQQDVVNIPVLMAQADLAISAAGSTCWELCLLGLPAVLLDLANNQTPIAIEMHRRGCALHVGRATDLSQKELTAPVRDLLTSKELRTSFSSRCRQLVDGLGADRVLSAMFAIEGKPVFAGTCQ